MKYGHRYKHTVTSTYVSHFIDDFQGQRRYWKSGGTSAEGHIKEHFTWNINNYRIYNSAMSICYVYNALALVNAAWRCVIHRRQQCIKSGIADDVKRSKIPSEARCCCPLSTTLCGHTNALMYSTATAWRPQWRWRRKDEHRAVSLESGHAIGFSGYRNFNCWLLRILFDCTPHPSSRTETHTTPGSGQRLSREH